MFELKFVHPLTNSIAVIVTNSLIRDYMINYARTLIYTTSLSYANVIAVDCSFDMLNNGTAHDVCQYTTLPPIVMLTTIEPSWPQKSSSYQRISSTLSDPD
jgi:hypothetical protein